MAEQDKTSEVGTPRPVVCVAPAPHVFNRALTTRRMMIDVLIGLAPVIAWSIYVFGWYAVRQLGICILSCLTAELIFTAMRRRPASLGDFSAAVTGAILALSLPATAPWHVGVIAGFVAIGIGKIIFGGLGQNIFNPAMVGRAFVMIAFTGAMAATAYVRAGSAIEAITKATPLTAMKQDGVVTGLLDFLLGTTNGSLGETNAVACVIGGLYLCIRRTASWEIPLGVLLSAGVIAGAINLTHPQAQWTALHHLLAGSLMFGAFFIATDPVSSPLTPKGKFIFGLGIGALVMLIRTLSAYPEGVMFSVLIMNSLVPLINVWTIPRPLGGPLPARVSKQLAGPPEARQR
jgi:electron transport complex protein RnfD